MNTPHYTPRTFGDRFAYAFVRFLRFFADLFLPMNCMTVAHRATPPVEDGPADALQRTAFSRLPIPSISTRNTSPGLQVFWRLETNTGADRRAIACPQFAKNACVPGDTAERSVALMRPRPV